MLYRIATKTLLCLFLAGLAVFIPLHSAVATNQKADNLVFSVKPLALLAAAIHPDAGSVASVIVPQNSNIHDFRLGINDMVLLKSADAVIWLGAKYEPSLAAAYARLGKPQHWRAIDLSEHVWLDGDQLPLLVNMLADVLKQQFPASVKSIDENSKQLIHAIQSVQQAQREQLQPFSSQAVLLGHAALEGLLQQVGIHNIVFYQAGHHHGRAADGARSLLEVQSQLKTGNIDCAIEEAEVSFTMLKQRFPTLQLAHINIMAAGYSISSSAFVEFYNTIHQDILTCLQGDSSDGAKPGKG